MFARTLRNTRDDLVTARNRGVGSRAGFRPIKTGLTAPTGSPLSPTGSLPYSRIGAEIRIKFPLFRDARERRNFSSADLDIKETPWIEGRSYPSFL